MSRLIRHRSAGFALVVSLLAFAGPWGAEERGIGLARSACAQAPSLPPPAPGTGPRAIPPGTGGMTGSGSEADARPTVDAITVQELARLEGQGEVVIRGIGIVTGLKGTGDSGSDLVLARPLAKIYESNGNPIGDLRELAKSKSAAIVLITCTIPASGARTQDKIDVHVTVSHSATSLAGGRLFLAPMQGPLPGQGVFAFAEGPIVLEDAGNPTAGIIRAGAHVTHDILMPVGHEVFRLIVHPHYRSFGVTERLATTINARFREPVDAADQGADVAGLGSIAQAIDDTVIEITVPPEYRKADQHAGFIADVLTASLSPDELRLPAQVVVNQRTGSIIVTGNVEISPCAIAHKDLVVTTTTPSPVPSPANPLTRTSKWATTGTTSRASDKARVQDLLQAFKQLDVPVNEQINILMQMHRAGRLHARLVIE